MTDHKSNEHDAGPATPRPQGGTSLTLLERLRANEPDAWGTMVRLYTPLVFHWCARGGVRGADADDISQEVFRAAAAGFAAFRRERAGDTFRGWLRGITRNMLLQHFRRSGRQPAASGGTEAFVRLHEVTDAAPGLADEDDPAPEVEGLRRRALELVRCEFEDRTWQMFWVTVVDGRSPVDIAAELGVTPAAVRKAKSRVLHRLREQFGELIQ
jgi:RNA polymerase sigma-70 factor (ECF subfamily)